MPNDEKLKQIASLLVQIAATVEAANKLIGEMALTWVSAGLPSGGAEDAGRTDDE